MAIFNTHPDDPIGYPFAPRLHMVALLMGLFFNNESWSVLDLNLGEIPTVEYIS
jgi:hypothetical protein